MMRVVAMLVAALAAFSPAVAHAASDAGGHGGTFPLLFFFLAVMLLFARIGALAERVGQPAVLGELLLGVFLGVLAWVPGLGVIETLKHETLVKDIAEIGVILLLFRAGLESNIGEMARVGKNALFVALIGVAVPFATGFFASQMLLPGLSTNVYLFIGATLTATSVGITARVFKDLGTSKSPEAKIVLGAAVIDDVLGLMILAVVSSIIKTGSLDPTQILVISAKAFAFLSGSILLGRFLSPRISALFSKVHTGHGMKMAIAFIFCAGFAYVASLMGLAMIVGAFAAGLVLDPVHFKDFLPPAIVTRLRAWASSHPQMEARKEMEEHAEHEEHAHVENLIDDISRFFVPIFFVYTGLQVNLSVFGDVKIVGVALVITAIAVFGKLVAGLAAGKGMNRLLVGVGMVPRGEVGLIFANIGRGLGVVDDRLFATIVIVVILTTFVTPFALSMIAKKARASA
ncbi:MAG: cation:proton antiporter [Patescibacteria group bacterium]|nr:MAG: cation:proton antiporter [Patescibacteria group bacterium]